MEFSDFDNKEINDQLIDLIEYVKNDIRDKRMYLKCMKAYQKKYNKMIKELNKKKKKVNPNKKKSGFSAPQIVPKEFHEQPWGCDPDVKLPRPVLTKMVYGYIEDNDLKDPDNKRIIKPDKTIIKLFHLKKNDILKFETFQTFMAKLYKPSKNITNSDSDSESEIETESKPKKKKSKKETKRKNDTFLNSDSDSDSNSDSNSDSESEFESKSKSKSKSTKGKKSKKKST